jgi:2-phosphosulfolactate phosphatase
VQACATAASRRHGATTSRPHIDLPGPWGLTAATPRAENAAWRRDTSLEQALQKLGSRISVIPAGERWEDGSLRPAIEDLLGAGAIVHYLPGTCSPEAAMAEAAFLHFRSTLTVCLQQCSSGKELIGRGFASDVALAAAVDQSTCVPVLTNNAYVRYTA